MYIQKKYLLVGSPNSGKTTLFNALTGLYQKTANYPGVTVEKCIGQFTYHDSLITIVDLPGIYSLYSDAIDENLAVNEILNTEYDGLILVVNADQLQKNLLLVLQILDLKKPCILVLNMIDEAQKNKICINNSALSDILKTNVVSTNARTGEGIEELKNKLSEPKISSGIFYDLQMFQNNQKLLPDIRDYIEWIRLYKKQATISDSMQNIAAADLKYKNSLVNYITAKTINKSIFQDKKHVIDKYLTHKIWGFIFLIITLLIVFQLVFFIAEYPMRWIEWGIGSFSIWVKSFLPETEWTNLIINGLIPGITGVIMFVPQIALLFLMIGILEESGYMARISFLLDSIFSKFGLSGKSLVPLVSGVACAVPSILSTRTISNVKEKFITVLILPFISCSARLPVYTLLIGLIFPEDDYYGFFNIKGIVLLGLYLFGLVMALAYGWLFNKIVHLEKRSFFFIELPSYKIPYWKNLTISIWNKVKVFITDAGKIIIAVSIILWYLSTHTFPSVQNKLEQKYVGYQNNAFLQQKYKKELLENSYIGMIGKSIEPLIMPLGYDWKIGIALITSFAAREVFVGTMATLYSAGSDDNIISLRDKIKIATQSNTEKPAFTTATSFSLLVYYALAMQCISTMVVAYKELKSLKWAIIQFLTMTGSAYVMAFLVYRFFSN